MKNKDKVKSGKLSFLSNFLLGKQISVKVDVDHIDLLDYDDQFDSYHWDRIAYNTTIDLIRKNHKRNWM